MNRNFKFFKYLKVISLKELKRKQLNGTIKTCKYKEQANISMAVVLKIIKNKYYQLRHKNY